MKLLSVPKKFIPLFWGLVAVASAQEYDFSKLDTLLTEAAQHSSPGLEVLMVHNGRQIYWKQFEAWPKNNQASIASATKWLSGALIMSLVDDHVLSLDDKASKYLPYMTGEKAPITVRQLMSHTSGFPGEFPLADPCLGDPNDTLANCAEALAKVPLQAPPGTAFIYSGAGMQIAGRVAEVAAGKDWQTLFRERIAGPLGLTQTDYDYKGPTENPRISGGGRSTVSDYMRFLTMLYQRGVFEGRSVLSTRAVDIMLRDQTAGAPDVHSPGPAAWVYGIGNWVEVFDSKGTGWRNSSVGAAGWTPMFDRSRNLLVVVGMQNLLRPFQPYYEEFLQTLAEIIPPAKVTPMGVTNGASYEPGPLVPGEIITLFGQDLATTQTTSVQVTLDGAAVPLLYVSPTQLTAMLPLDWAGKGSAELQVVSEGNTSPLFILPVAEASPALFSMNATGQGQGAILNQDNTPNSPDKPAARGSVLQLFGTGGGAIAGSALVTQPVAVTIGGVSAKISYAGPAPGMLAGVFQVNASIPGDTVTGDAVPIAIQVGPHSSPDSITVAVK